MRSGAIRGLRSAHKTLVGASAAHAPDRRPWYNADPRGLFSASQQDPLPLTWSPVSGGRTLGPLHTHEHLVILLMQRAPGTLLPLQVPSGSSLLVEPLNVAGS